MTPDTAEAAFARGKIAGYRKALDDLHSALDLPGLIAALERTLSHARRADDIINRARLDAREESTP